MPSKAASASNMGKLWLIERALMQAINWKPGRVRPLTYEELGAQVGHPTRGPWKDFLDYIAFKYANQGLPDITLIVRAAPPDNYPKQLDYIIRKGRKPTRAERRRATQKMQDVIDRYNPGSRNPY